MNTGTAILTSCFAEQKRGVQIFTLQVSELTDYHLFVRCRPFTYLTILRKKFDNI